MHEGMRPLNNVTVPLWSFPSCLDLLGVEKDHLNLLIPVTASNGSKHLGNGRRLGMQLQDGEIIVFVACFSCDSYTHGEAHKTEHDEVVSPHISVQIKSITKYMQYY